MGGDKLVVGGWLVGRGVLVASPALALNTGSGTANVGGSVWGVRQCTRVRRGLVSSGSGWWRFMRWGVGMLLEDETWCCALGCLDRAVECGAKGWM